jgi:uncharacterized protein YecE (DUF72 family)
VAEAWVGTSGWSYKHWDGRFYPEKVLGTKQLPFLAEHFRTVEINYSYYQLPTRKVFEGWRARSPDGFVFAVKASRYLTHMRKLREPEEPLQRLLERASGLEEKLGPFLFQFPRTWDRDLPRLTSFFEALQAHPGHRYAFEFRHDSWLCEEVYAVLKQHNAALCLPIGWGVPLDVQVTADWTYIRFHGGQHGIGFSDAELRPWADRIRGYQAQGVDSYVYFNNDQIENDQPQAILNAKRLLDMLDNAGVRDG